MVVLRVILAALMVSAAVYSAMPSTCDTDAQCAMTRQCIFTPGCDGGPYSQPYWWLP